MRFCQGTQDLQQLVKVIGLEARLISTEALTELLHLRHSQTSTLLADHFLGLPCLDDAIEELHQASLHGVLVICGIAARAHPKARPTGGVRRHIHVAGLTTPQTGHVT
eukprot:Skav227742  [mRNA]  locus=scaffold3513:181702:189326:+ [translate_table: standard]